MKIGDVLILVDDSGWKDQPYTSGKHYIIFKIEYLNISGEYLKYGYIRNDQNDAVYFSEINAETDGWKFLHKLRKEKLEKLKKISK